MKTVTTFSFTTSSFEGEKDFADVLQKWIEEFLEEEITLDLSHDSKDEEN